MGLRVYRALLSQKLSLALLSFVTLYTSHLYSAVSDPVVRVRLKELQQKWVLEGENIFVRKWPLTNPSPMIALPSPVTFTIKSSGVAVEGGKKSSFLALHFRDGLQLEGRNMKSGAELFPHKLRVTPRMNKNGFDVIGLVPFETYLENVLPWEMPPSWPKEALRAQAISARSYTRARMRERTQLDFDVEATVEDQVYKMAIPGSPYKKQDLQKVNSVIRSTRNFVLEDRKGGPLLAQYHADCGGHTESAGTGVRRDYIGVLDAGCPVSDQSRWRIERPRDEILESLHKIFPQEQKVVGFQVQSRKESGRIDRFWITFRGGKGAWIEVDDFRRAVGFSVVRSAQFDVHQLDQLIIVEGRGYGHGFGLCQWGSRYWAEHGWTAEEILRHYYSQAELRTAEAKTVEKRIESESKSGTY